MVTLIFLRHGLSQTNNTGRFTGQVDVPLHELGHTQAQDVAKFFQTTADYKIDKIYSSPSSRAYHTALPTAKAFNLPIEKVERLKEVDVGNWGGQTLEQVRAQYPKEFEVFLTNVGLARYGDGESTAEAQARMKKIVEEIAQENENKTVLIATHGAVLRALFCAWENIPLGKLKDVKIVPNASISVATFENGTGKFLRVGYDEYLSTKTPHTSFQKFLS